MKGRWDIEFEVLGDPKALKRHRTFRKGNFMGAYDPSKGDKADFLAKAMIYVPKIPIDGPIFLFLKFYFSRPKSHFRTGKKSHELKDNAPLYHTVRPDIDNLQKFILDSLNKVFWKDDTLISYIVAEKCYSFAPRIEIKIKQL